MKLKNTSYIFLLFFFFVSCKSTKSTKNNRLDITSNKIEQTSQKIKVSTIDLDIKEIVLKVANPLKPIIIIDKKGNIQIFKNVKSVKIKAKTEIKKDSVSSEKKDLKEKFMDKSTIKETAESISDTNNYKGIFIALAFIVAFILVGYLVFKFKK